MKEREMDDGCCAEPLARLLSRRTTATNKQVTFERAGCFFKRLGWI